MKFQVSFDLSDLDKSILIARDILEFVDILEVGSVLINKYGLSSVQRFREEFPEKEIFADLKLVDRVEQTIVDFAEVGANSISVLAGTTNSVIQNATKVAHDNNCKITLDLVDSDSLGQSAMDSEILDVDNILLHSSHETKGLDKFQEEWEHVHGNTKTPIFISGGINRENIKEILKLKPFGIIIGSAITEADDPKKEAEFFRNLLDK